MSKKYFRKQWVIIPSFQYHFMNRLFLMFVMVVCLFSAQAINYFYEMKQMGLVAGFPDDHTYYAFINSVISKYVSSFAITIVITSLVFYAYGLYMSNRIAGPIFSLNRGLKNRLDGSNPNEPIRVREDDYFQDLAANIKLSLEKNK
ncbi:MAG: hypothetical protein AABY53_05785 [Bdellovibrionota bacterium]